MATISKNNNATRVPVLIDRESYDTYKAFSEETGIPVARAVREALGKFAPTLTARTKALAAVATKGSK